MVIAMKIFGDQINFKNFSMRRYTPIDDQDIYNDYEASVYTEGIVFAIICEM